MNEKRAWRISSIVTLILVVILVFLWDTMTKYDNADTLMEEDCIAVCNNLKQKVCDCIEQSAQLEEEIDVETYLNKAFKKDSLSQLLKIKTGFFIQSLKFFNSSEVSLSGYVWQHYDSTKTNAIKLKKDEIGFIFPEQVNTAADISPREVYREKTETGETIGWYFEVTLRQPFDYKKYPFDHKTVWLRVWPSRFLENIILTPDLQAYKSTDKYERFAKENAIVLGAWTHEDTYYNYRKAKYDTNFGLTKNFPNVRKDIIGWNMKYPELHLNFVVKRKFENAFITYLFPLFLIAALLFAAMLTISSEKKKESKLGFNAFGFIGATSGLFFVLMLAHIQLREQFAGTDIVYIEYFYILMYCILVIATINAYLFSIEYAKLKNIILYKNNLIPKITYWPFLIGCLILITLFFV